VAERDRVRDQAASDRDDTADGRDRAAELRDRGAEDRDALETLGQASSSDLWALEIDEAQVNAADDRQDAADDRLRAADDRDDAASDRAEALQNRVDSAEAERRALETLESMSDAFFTLDDEWRFTYLNPQTEAILQRKRTDLLGKNMWDEFPEAIGARPDDEYRRALREQRPVRFEEHYAPLGRTLEIRAYPMPNGLAVYFSDVTTARRQEERLRESQRLEAIGRVTAEVAHDFNNLLAAVRGFAQLGRAAAVDEKTTHYFDEINNAGHRAAELTSQLLAFARKQELSPVATELNDAVESLYSVLRELVPSRIELQLALSPGPVPVFVDRSKLERVITNLIVNSRDAIDTTGSIILSTTTEAPPGTIHEIRASAGWLQVTDTGSGIAADALPHIFEPFFSTKGRDEGTGLGLATIHGIVAQSGGDIFVDSTPGLGTTMTVGLPATA
jgi:PAS domain S-box-containing protein